MIWLFVFLMLPLVPLIILEIAQTVVALLTEAFNLD